MKLKSGQTLLFVGDSITDCGRRAEHAPLGQGYVMLVRQYLTLRYPDRKINIINKGIGGNTVVDLRQRWQDDVLRHKPDFLSIKVGINDLSRTMRNNPEAVPPTLYRQAYEAILQRTRKALPDCRLLLIDPFYISTENSPDSFRTSVLKLIPEYLDVVEKLSRQFDTLHVRTHKLFAGLLKHHDPDTFCPEPVHPNLTGHMVIADAVYEALGGK